MVNQKIAIIVDDEIEVVNILKELLQNELHYLVLTATDPQVAVDLAKRYLFDLLILDLHMPKLDGFQVLDIVRTKQPEVKVIIITGLLQRYEEKLKRVQVDKIVEKPIDFNEFKTDVISIAGSVETERTLTKLVPKAKILLVDDEKEQCEYLKEFILGDKPNYYEVEIAETAKEAFELNNEFAPDLVLFDIKMPNMRGDVMMEQIKAGEGHKPKLFIALSAIALTETIERLKEAGCPYITKPFRIEELLELIRDKCLELNLVNYPSESAAE